MPRGLADTFPDGLAKVMQQISLLKMTPDADYNVISDLENIVLSHFQQQNVNAQASAMQAASNTAAQVQGQPPMPGDMSGVGAPGPMSAPPVPIQGPPGGMPVTSADLSRGPVPALDQNPLAAAIAAQMAGQGGGP